MKTSRSDLLQSIALLSALVLVLAFAAMAGAAPITKAATGTNLNASVSWLGNATPTSADVATWDSVTPSLGAGLTLGANTNWLGIDVQGGASDIAISGAGSLTLGTSGINIASGGVNLSLTNSRAFGASSTVNVDSGRILTLFGGTTTFGAGTTTSLTGAGNMVFGGSSHTIAGSGALTIGSGSVLQNNLQSGSSSATFSGTTTLNGGTISISSSVSTFGTGAINLNGGIIGSFSATGRTITNSVTVGGDSQIGGSVANLLSTGFIDFTGPVNLGGATRAFDVYATGVLTGHGSGLVFDGVVSSGGLTLNSTPGNGIMTLTNDANTFSGATTVNAGNLATSLGSLANSSSVTVNGTGKLSLGINGTTLINNLNGASGAGIRTDFTISGTAGARTLSVNQTSDGTYAGTFTEGSSRPISLTKNGSATLILAGAATYTGATTVSNGTLQVNGSTVAGGSLMANGTIGGAVTLNAGGRLGGSGIVSGTVTVQSGGTLAAGTNGLGTLTINNTVTLQSGSTNLMRINKSGVLLSADQIAGTGSLALNGTLVMTATGDPLAHGDTFTLFTKGSYTGFFVASNLPALTGSLAWDLSKLTNNGTIRVYNTSLVSTPIFSPVAGGVASPQSVTLASDVGATIYYTTNGGPLTNVYGGPIALPANTTSFTIGAYATKAGFSDSTVASATYSTTPVPTWVQVAGGSWTNAADWSNSVVANFKSVTADFSTLTLAADTTVTLDGAETVGNLVFADQGNTYNWIVAPGVSAALTLDSASGVSTVNVSNPTTTIGAVLAGTNSLTKTGNGTLALTNANTYSGGTTISNGTLQLGTGGNNIAKLGAGNVSIAAGATLSVAWSSGVIVLGNNLAGSGTFVRGGTSELALTGTNSFSGLYQIPNYTLAFRGTNSANGQPRVFVDTAGNLALGNEFVGQTCTISELSGSGGVNPQFDSASGTKTLNINQASTTNFSGVMRDATSGSRYLAVTKSGPGTLTLSGANTYTGPTTVTGGLLEIASPGSLGATAVTVNSNAVLAASGSLGGAVTVQPGGRLLPTTVTSVSALGTPLSIAGNVSLNGTVTFRISKDTGVVSDQIAGSGSVTYGGTLVVTNVTTDTNATPLALGDTFNLFSGSPLTGNFSSYVLPALPGSLIWDVSGLSSGTISVVSGTPTALAPSFSPLAGGYIGAQTVTIASVNSGATTTIHYSTDNVNWSSAVSPVTVVVPVDTNATFYAYATAPGYNPSATNSAAYSTLDRGIWIQPAGGSWADAASFSWSNNIIPNASGATADFSTLTLNANTTLTLDGAKEVGGLRFADQGNTYAWFLTNGTGGPLTLDAGANVPVVDVANQATTIGAVVAGTNGLIKTGAGTLALSGANTYAGATTVSNGTLALAYSYGFGSTRVQPVNVAPGATLNLAASSYGIGYGQPITITGGTLTNSGAACYANNLTLAEGAIVTGNGLRMGYFTVGATLTASGATASTYAAPIALVKNTTQTMTLNIGGAGLTIGGAISDLGGFTGEPVIKNGSGTLVLNATNTYLGPTTVSNGTLLVNGSLAAGSAVTVEGGTLGGTGTIGGTVTVNSGGTLAPGASFGTLNISNAVTLNAGSISTFEVNGSTPTNDVVILGSTVAYGGTLNIVPTGTFTNGQTFTLFSGAGATNTGNFAAVTGSPGAGLTFSFTNGVLSVVSTASPGPVVTLTSPANSATYAAYATVPLSATVVTNGYVITSVDFLTNGVVVASASSEPYSADWVLAAPGSYTVTASANYASTNVVSTNSATITVNAVVNPTVGATTKVAGGGVVFTVTGPNGQHYTVLTSTNVTTPVSGWLTNSSGFFDVSGTLNVTNTPPLDGKRFFRVRTP